MRGTIWSSLEDEGTVEKTAMNEDRKNKPHDLCILRSDSECESCPLEQKLDCHFRIKKLLRFAFVVLFIAITGSAALIFYGLLNQFYIFLFSFIVFSLVFFEVWEIEILCSHCPFHAERRKTLHSYVNCGSLKIWSFQPGPMSRSEKIQFATGLTIFVAILLLPSAILILSEHYLLAMPPSVGLAAFGYILRRSHCNVCFNFSCPLNAVPRNVVDEFLRRNPVMLRAWENR
jgi:hypothetical protein